MIVAHRHYANGIDVSDNNGDFDWHSWQGAIEFAMIKATEGSSRDYPNGYHDVQFARNWEGARSIGVHRFAYHYFRFDPLHDPARQAADFVRVVTEQGLDLVDNFVVDWEEPTEGYSVHAQAFAVWVFCTEVQRLTEHKHRMLVYTFPAFADAGYCAMLGRWDLWIANWNAASPTVPPPWSNPSDGRPGWHFWQFAPGRTNGTRPDLDRFNGSPHELEVYCTR